MSVPETTSHISFPEPSFVERHGLNPAVFALVCLAVIFVLYQVVAGSITFFVLGTTQLTRENVMAVRILTMAGQLLFILVPTVILARLLTRRSHEVFPWRIPSLPETIFALVGLLCLQQLFQIYLFFQDMIPLPHVLEESVTQFRQMLEQMFKTLVTAESIPELILVVAVVAFVPGIVEELFFRGLIQGSLAKRVTPVGAALIAGVVFGLYHFNPFAVVPLMGLGCYFGLLRLRSNSIVVAMTAHFVNNALAVLAVYFSMSEDLILGAKEGGDPEIGTVLMQLVIYGLLFVASFVAYLRTTSPREGPES
jgi:hypothetical protein